jgi:hypothetical protein
MIEGQVYRCESCTCEIRVIRSSKSARTSPHCGCGARMKMPYRKPAAQKINLEATAVAAAPTNRT